MEHPDQGATPAPEDQPHIGVPQPLERFGPGVQQGYQGASPDNAGTPPQAQSDTSSQRWASTPTSAAPSLPQQKNRRRLWITLSLVMLLLLVGVGAFVYLHQPSTPAKTLETVCNALKSGDATTLYDQLSANLKSQYLHGAQGFYEYTKFRFSGQGGIKDCHVNVAELQEQASSATGAITFTFGNGLTRDGFFALLKENGIWKLDSF